MKKLFLVTCLLAFLGWLFIQSLGCDSPKLSLQIKEQAKPGFPVFDLTDKWMLTKNGFERINNYALVEITIRELDGSNNEIATCWSIDNKVMARDVRRVTYGETPAGWDQVVSPKPLNRSSRYSLNHTKIFKVDENWHYTVSPKDVQAKSVFTTPQK